ncbi:MAG: type IV pilus biogenesis/stability protein PilW, partial [Gemmatimonadota bacterium]
AEEEYRRAIASNPNHATAHHWYGLLLESMGRLDEALAQGRMALSLDPLSPPINTSFGELLLDGRDYPAAIDQLEKTREIVSPDFPTWGRSSRAPVGPGRRERSWIG